MQLQNGLAFSLRCLSFAALVAAGLALGECASTRAADEPGWQQLFNGKNLDGWRQGAGRWMAAKAAPLDPADPRLFKIEPGSGLLVNGLEGKEHNLFSTPEFGDIEAHFEFVIPKGSQGDHGPVAFRKISVRPIGE